MEKDKEKSTELLKEMANLVEDQTRDNVDHTQKICDLLNKAGDYCPHDIRTRKTEFDTDKVEVYVCEECGTAEYIQR